MQKKLNYCKQTLENNKPDNTFEKRNRGEKNFFFKFIETTDGTFETVFDTFEKNLRQNVWHVFEIC